MKKKNGGTLQKTGSYWVEEYATSEPRRSSRAEVNKFLFACIILFKRVYFRQYFEKKYLIPASYFC